MSATERKRLIQDWPEESGEAAQLVIDAYGEPDESTDTRLHLSDGTVRNYLSEAIGKLGATNRVAATRLARERGWL